MRHTKAALLLFGFGLMLGFILVVGGVDGFGWVASAIMVLALLLLPPALLADGRGLAVRAWLARLPRHRGRKPRGRARPTPSRRSKVRPATCAPRRRPGR